MPSYFLLYIELLVTEVTAEGCACSMHCINGYTECACVQQNIMEHEKGSPAFFVES